MNKPGRVFPTGCSETYLCLLLLLQLLLPYGADHGYGFAVVLRTGAVTVGAVVVAVLRQLLLLFFVILHPVLVAVAVL
ncbi:hypothetical protein INR49_013280 [Caranx melampygus]|nr:hypothetical protein INR49_013280 [Caranx melampygus]